MVPNEKSYSNSVFDKEKKWERASKRKREKQKRTRRLFLRKIRISAGCSKNVGVLGRKENHVAGGVERDRERGGGVCLNLAALEHESIFFFFVGYIVRLCWNLWQQRAVTAYLVASQLPDDVGRLHFLRRNIIGSRRRRRRRSSCQFPPRTKHRHRSWWIRCCATWPCCCDASQPKFFTRLLSQKRSIGVVVIIGEVLFDWFPAPLGRRYARRTN